MNRFGSLATALALILLLVPALSAQEPADRSVPKVDCDSICLISPGEAPAECACGIEIITGETGGVAGGSLGSSEVVDPAAAAVIEAMRASYRDALAGVQNYTVIQVSRANGVQLGPPAPGYYEIDDVDGERMPRLISPAEVARRQAAESGQPAPEQMASGIATMLRMLGEGIGEDYTPADEGERTFINLFNAVAGTGIAQDAADELDKTAEELALEESNDDLFLELMGMKELGKRLRLEISQPCETFPSDRIMDRATLIGLQCLRLGASAEDLAGLDLGAAFFNYELTEVGMIVAAELPPGAGSGYNCMFDCYLIQDQVQTGVEVLPIPLNTIFTYDSPNGGGIIERSATSAQVVNSQVPIIPRRTKSKILGLNGLQEVTTEVYKVFPNEGTLAADRLAREIVEVQQQVTNN